MITSLIVPDLYVQRFEHPGLSCTEDRFGYIAWTSPVWIYTQVGGIRGKYRAIISR